MGKLGSLTIDIAANVAHLQRDMRDASKVVRGSLGKMAKEAKQASKALAVVGVGAGAGLAALTVETVASAKEIQNLSRVANTSTDDFQKYAAGAKAFGIEQEKLADIFKDTADKVGDFTQTGGGALADFFEKVAPQVGVTAEQFRKLSGPDALQLYVSSLEKANVSQSDMTFYMEAIASDATLLLPLLQDGGEGFRVFGEEAEKAGAIMSGDTLDSANRLSAAMFLSEQATEGFKNQLTGALLDDLADFSELLFDVSVDGQAAATVGDSIAEGMKFIAKSAVGVVSAFDLVGKAIGGYYAVLFSVADIDVSNALNPFRDEAGDAQLEKDLARVSSTIEAVKKDLAGTAEAYADTLAQIDEIGKGGSGDAESRVNRLAELFKKQRELANDRALGGGGTGDEDQENINKQAEKIRESLLSEEDSVRESYARRREIILKNTEITGEAQKTLLNKLAAERDESLAKIEESAPGIQSIVELNKALTESLTPQEAELQRLTAEYENLEAAMALFPDRAPEIEEALKRVKTEMEEVGKNDGLDGLVDYAQEAAKGMQDALADFLFDPFDEGLDGMLKGFGQMVQRMIAEAAAAQLMNSLVGDFAKTGKLGGFVGDIFGGGFAEGGRPDPGKVSIVGEKGPELFIPDGVRGTVLSNTDSRNALAGGGSFNLTQNINVAPNTDRRTASQIANVAARKQQMAQARFAG